MVTEHLKSCFAALQLTVAVRQVEDHLEQQLLLVEDILASSFDAAVVEADILPGQQPSVSTVVVGVAAAAASAVVVESVTAAVDTAAVGEEVPAAAAELNPRQARYIREESPVAGAGPGVADRTRTCF